LACPIPFFGEILQRRSITGVRQGTTNGSRNLFYGFNLPWPDCLKNGFPRLVFFLIAATLATTFAAKPQATGIAILVLLVLATVMALVWRQRSFCQHLCPINTFIGTYAKTGKLALRKVDPVICSECKPVFCEKGSTGGWACPYELNVRDISNNVDCGLCTECIKSCHYNNVTLRWRKFASESTVGSISLAWTIMALFVIASAYTILYLGHWPRIRDYVNILDKGNWDLFGIYALSLWSTALIIFPLIYYIVTGISKRVSRAEHNTLDLMIASSGALLPLGLFVWFAFIIQMLFTNLSFVGQSLSDPFGWGWNLLGLAGTPWKQFLPRFIPWIQVFLVLTGFGYSLRNLWCIWVEKTANIKTAFRGVIPLVLFLGLLTSIFIWFYAN
jgi:hypothetical protein